jgi:oligopeptide transport system substrate-binding protein
MKKSLQLVFSLLLTAAMIFSTAACDTAGQPGEENLAKVWRTTFANNIGSFNPHMYNMSNDGDLITRTSMPLTKLNWMTNQWEYVGHGAVGLPEVSDCGLIWTFTVREGLQWSDGTPINAHDWEYSAKQLLDPGLTNRNATSLYNSVRVVGARAYFLGPELAIEDGLEPVTDWADVGVKALDDYTIQYTLQERTLDILGIQALGGQWLVHRESWEAGFNEDRSMNNYGLRDWVDMPFNGPYRLAAYEPDQFYVLEKNHDYVQADNYIRERYEVRFSNVPATLDMLFDSGLTDVRGVGNANWAQYEFDPRVVFGTGGQPWYLSINMNHEELTFLGDNNFRKALFYGIDRETIAWDIMKVANPSAFIIKTDSFVGNILAGETVVSFRSLPQAQSIVPDNHGFLPELAIEYFNKAYEAYGRKIVVEFLLHDSATQRLMGEFLQESLENLFGSDKFEVTLAYQVSSSVYASMRAGDFEIGFGSVTQSSPNPWTGTLTQFNTWFVGKHQQFYCDEWDALYAWLGSEEGVAAPTDVKIDTLVEMERRLLDYLPVVPIYQSDAAQVYSDRVTILTREWAAGIGWRVVELIPIATIAATELMDAIVD